MNKFKFYFIALSAAVVLFSCNKADDLDYEILHEYGTQYENDSAVIIDYLHGHYISSYIDHPGFSDDQDVVISKITNAAEQQSLWDSPLLHSIDVDRNDITYKVYYLQLREGDAVNGKNPSRVDNVLVSYEGTYLRLGEEPTLFDSAIYPDSYFALNSLIIGWSEIMPLFKTGVFNQAASEGGPA
ncbi:MAG TPA: hypothetical protein VK541_06600, partial [Pedobacter sp.]|uniref:hypothetical protein n=1 Tax=Pedobacter sp. TaxID=1411316 RepID=UPI002CB465A9